MRPCFNEELGGLTCMPPAYYSFINIFSSLCMYVYVRMCARVYVVSTYLYFNILNAVVDFFTLSLCWIQDFYGTFRGACLHVYTLLNIPIEKIQLLIKKVLNFMPRVFTFLGEMWAFELRSCFFFNEHNITVNIIMFQICTFTYFWCFPSC